MRSVPLLIEAVPEDRYRVTLRFEDGVSARVDLSYLLEYGGVFAPLREPDYFRKLRVDADSGTIAWPNNADIAPETLYARASALSAAG
ncbi:MAG: DUF2442 domain-containing protein [Solirubrobacterales bacterium]|nr:DUF2442 domain-containing protein [Solirubrobacterales bacterium]OJU94913.1 MAG: hypothetical protein BGO23_07005 [Solirubrobacterales bacterium 67-14]